MISKKIAPGCAGLLALAAGAAQAHNVPVLTLQSIQQPGPFALCAALQSAN